MKTHEAHISKNQATGPVPVGGTSSAASSQVVTTERDGDVALITLAHPPVNALSVQVRRDLMQHIEAADADPNVKVICLMGQGGSFSTGLDITEASGDAARYLEPDPSLNALCNRIENCRKPVVAGLQGSTLGGGLAIAVAAHYRVGGAKARLGTPDAALGLVPGGGLTQRLPRLVGVGAALELMLSGKPVSGTQAAKFGLVDRVSEGRVGIDTLDFCRELAAEGAEPIRTRDRAEHLSDGATFMAEITKRRADIKSSRLDVPKMIVDCVEAALLMPFSAGVFREEAARADSLASDQSHALRHAYFAERRASRPVDLDLGLAQSVDRIGVVGTSNIALGIAICALEHGLGVHLVGAAPDDVVLAQRKIELAFERSVQEGRLPPEVRDARLAKFAADTALNHLSECGLVIEATNGSVDRRAQSLTRIEEFLPETVALATISDRGYARMARDLAHPERFLGLHFFAPAQGVRVVEVARLDALSAKVLATAHTVMRKMGKCPVHVAARDGLIANHVQDAVWAAVDVLLLVGVTPAQIDRAMTAYGMAMGPCETMDALGLNHFEGIVVKLLSAEGQTGRSAGAGFYTYDSSLMPNAQAQAKIDALRKEARIPRLEMSDTEVVERILLAQANAGARLLELGIASRPVDVDVVMLLSKGFPRWHGGPMLAADLMRPLQVQKKLRQFSPEAPDIWDPAPLWQMLVKNGDTLEKLNSF